MKHLLTSLALMLTIYGQSWCHYCHMQVEYCKKNNIEYKYVEKMYPGIQGVPVLVNADGQIHEGYLEGKDLALFMNVGPA